MTRKKRRKFHLSFSFFPKKIKGWKKHQEKIRFKRLGKKWLVVFGLWLVVAFSFFGYKAFRFLTQSLAQEKGSSMSAPRWNGKTQTNLLVFSLSENPDKQISNIKYQISNIGIGSFNPAEGTLKFLVIPSEFLVITAKGAYPVKKLYALGATLNPPAETDFLVESVQSFLAVPLDGYLSLEGQEGEEGGRNIGNLHKQLKSPKIILSIPKLISFVRKDLKTNLSAGQLFRLLWQARKIRFDKLQVLEIPEHILSSERINTDEDVLLANEKLLDEFIVGFFSEQEIITERLKVSVKNGTKAPGIAGQAARFLKNLGIEVIEVGNAEGQNYEQTQILDYSGLPQSRTVQRLEDVFEVKSEKLEASEARRVDVEVVVGADF